MGGAGLIAIAVFLIVRGVLDIRRRDTVSVPQRESGRPRKTGGAVALGFLTGLAPCPFGWAILLLLLSLGRPDLIPPVIIVFGAGIFSFLLLVALAVMIFRAVVPELFSRFSRYSQLVSGMMLLVFGVLFFTPGITID